MKKFFSRIAEALPKNKKVRLMMLVLIMVGLVGAVLLSRFVCDFVAGMTILNL